MLCFVFILNVEHPFKEYNCSIEHVEQAKIRLIKKCQKLILEKKITNKFHTASGRERVVLNLFAHKKCLVYIW